MKLARLLPFLALVLGASEPSWPGGGVAPLGRQAPATSAVDLNLERSLLGEAEGARRSSDYTAAREMTAEVVERLLARPQAEQDASWLELLNAAGRAAWEAQDPRTARAAWQQVLEVRSRTLPDDHPDLQRARNNLAVAIKALGDFQAARVLQEKVLEVFSRTLANDHLDLQRARGNLAVTIKRLGDLETARSLEESVLEVFSRTLPDDDPDLQRAREGLGGTLFTLGDLQGARTLFEKVLEVRSRTLPDEHPDLQLARGNLALTIKGLGDLQDARALQEKVLEVRSRTLPDEHPDLQLARGNLALTIQELGDLQGARALEEKMLEVSSRTLPDDHPVLQAARLGLAGTIKALGDLQGARALEEKVLEVHSRVLPDNHLELQMVRANLAVTLKMLGDLKAARVLEERVLEVFSLTLSDDHAYLQSARNNLAVTLKALGELEAARALEEKVLEVRSRTLPDDHPDLQAARNNLALSLARSSVRAASARRGQEETGGEKERQMERCASLVDSLCRSQASAARRVLLTGSSRESEERCAQLARSLDMALSFAAGCGVYEPVPVLDRAAFVLAETTRGAALASARTMRLASGSAGYAELRESLRRAGDDLAGIAQKGTTSDEFRSTLARRERIERQLVAMAKELSGGEGLVSALDVERLAVTLGSRTAAVGFRRYARLTLESSEELDATGEPVVVERSVPSLCALVLRPGEEQPGGGRGAARLGRVELGAIEPIERAVQEWRAALGVGRDERGIPVEASASASSTVEKGRELRGRIFDPLLSALEGAEHLVVALDDVLHLVPLEVLPLDGDSGAAGPAPLLGDRWRIETRVTLWELLDGSKPAGIGGELLAVGGVSYGVPGEPGLEVSETGSDSSNPSEVEVVRVAAGSSRARDPGAAPRADSDAGILRGSAWSSGFAALPATAAEARELGRCFRDTFGSQGAVTLLERGDATRERFLECAPRARWLHVATHGWFAPESIRSWSDPEPLDEHTGLGLRLTGKEQIRGMSPMLLCGLALAGANLPEDALGRVPGLVTAEELSTLDLTGCELAVLSACDTNVGERRAGQGVASLQRALQMAGARSVITSLWKVPDEATKELMLDFYRRVWVEKKPKGQALWEAKTRLRDAQDERGEPRYTVRDWAAWVLTGEPE